MYISHEIRTPLSIANIGFDLIKTQLTELDTLLNEEGVDIEITSSTDMLQSSASMRHEMESPGARNTTCNSPEGASLNQRQVEINTTMHELDSITSDCTHSMGVAISILNDFISYEKTQNNILEMDKYFIPCTIIKSVVDEFSVEATHFKVDLTFMWVIPTEDISSLYIYADEHKISQVVRNYVSNALKFTPGGGVVTVKLSLSQFEGEPEVIAEVGEGHNYAICGLLRVEVKDTG